ncbi:MAG: RNA polymerase sporulation sigma factor SigH [Clostridia bacterium]|nr:RNA polymerase sporulation sigma factor SigH [Clostridia bacterium]
MQEQQNNVYFSTNKYTDLQDEEIIELIKQGDDQALSFLIDRYKELVNIKVSKYYIVGAEKEDTIQEGMIGLFKAIKSFDGTKQNSFKTFANICVERQLITAIKSSNRQKHMPLNSYLSLNNSAYENDDNDEELINTFDSKTIEDPLDTLMKKEYFEEIQIAMDKSLSGFEKQVLNRYIKGESYVDIATKLDAPVKSVDNAIQRIRKKAIKNLFNDTNS